MSQNQTQFDFKKALDQQDSFESFLSSKENIIKQRLNSHSPENKVKSKSWALVFVLMLSLIVMGTYTLLQSRHNDRELAALKRERVAGVLEENTQNIVTADGFSLVLNQSTPKAFEIGRQTGKFEFLENTEATTTKFLAKPTKGGQELLTGIEVSVAEYDNQLDNKSFSQKVLAKLGSSYEIKSEDVNLPKDFKVTKIQIKNDPESTAYYSAVTQDNYYLIKIYNQTSKYSDLNELSRFSDSLLQNLYLN